MKKISVLLTLFLLFFVVSVHSVHAASNSVDVGVTIKGVPPLTVTAVQEPEIDLILKRNYLNYNNLILVYDGELKDGYLNTDASKLQYGVFKVESVPGVNWTISTSNLNLTTEKGGELTVKLYIALGPGATDSDHFASTPDDSDIKYYFSSDQSLALADGQTIGYFTVVPYTVTLDDTNKLGNAHGTFTVTINAE